MPRDRKYSILIYSFDEGFTSYSAGNAKSGCAFFYGNRWIFVLKNTGACLKKRYRQFINARCTINGNQNVKSGWVFCVFVLCLCAAADDLAVLCFSNKPNQEVRR